MLSPSNRCSEVLVVGDWIIDDYLIMGERHSSISSYTGSAHYALDGSHVHLPFRELAGAGIIARALHGEVKNTVNERLHCMGAWSKNDHDKLHHFFHENCPLRNVNLSFSNRNCRKRNSAPEIIFYNALPHLGTTRVLRRYINEVSGPTLYDRLDYEDDRTDAPPDELTTLDKTIRDLPDTIDKIVIFDLRKGAVNSNVIERLVNRFQGATWCIRSKSEEPEWLEKVPLDRIELRALGPEILSRRNPFEFWMRRSPNVQLSGRAIEVIDSVFGRYRDASARPNILLSTRSRDTILVNSRGEVLAVFQTGENQLGEINRIGWATCLFANLSYELHKWHATAGQYQQPVSATQLMFDRAAEVATQCAISGGRLSRIQPPAPPGPGSDKVGVWEETHNAYKRRKRILTDPSCRTLDTWWGCPDVPGYVALADEKRENIRKLALDIRSYREAKSPKKSLAFLIRSAPGSGKTSLIRALYQAFDFSLIEDNITQMVRREEILSLFDRVATRQASDTKPVFVFVDEINAFLESAPVFGQFLQPLEDGVYQRGGHRFTLKPAVWLFAGTLTTNGESPATKYADFVDRMTMEVDLTVGEADMVSENLYVGAALLKRRFPNVRSVWGGVLGAFYVAHKSWARSPSSAIRAIRKQIDRLTDVSEDTVSRGHWEKANGELHLPPELEHLMGMEFRVS